MQISMTFKKLSLQECFPLGLRDIPGAVMPSGQLLSLAFQALPGQIHLFWVK